MPAMRTQIYLTDEQRELIDRIAQSEGLTLAEVVHRAIDAYLSVEVDPTTALEATFGAAPEIVMPSRDDRGRG